MGSNWTNYKFVLSPDAKKKEKQKVKDALEEYELEGKRPTVKNPDGRSDPDLCLMHSRTHENKETVEDIFEKFPDKVVAAGGLESSEGIYGVAFYWENEGTEARKVDEFEDGGEYGGRVASDLLKEEHDIYVDPSRF